MENVGYLWANIKGREILSLHNPEETTAVFRFLFFSFLVSSLKLCHTIELLNFFQDVAVVIESKVVL